MNYIVFFAYIILAVFLFFVDMKFIMILYKRYKSRNNSVENSQDGSNKIKGKSPIYIPPPYCRCKFVDEVNKISKSNDQDDCYWECSLGPDYENDNSEGKNCKFCKSYLCAKYRTIYNPTTSPIY